MPRSGRNQVSIERKRKYTLDKEYMRRKEKRIKYYKNPTNPQNKE